MGIDNNFIVLNKPHDLRMDGDFELTVQKLLLQWTGLPLSEQMGPPAIMLLRYIRLVVRTRDGRFSFKCLRVSRDS